LARTLRPTSSLSNKRTGGSYSDTAATYIQERNGADDNFGTDTVLKLEEEYRNSTHLIFQTLVGFFDLIGDNPGQIPLGATINSATLTMWPTSETNSGGGANTVGIHQMLKPWVEDEATWTVLELGPPESKFGDAAFVATTGGEVAPGGGEAGVDYAEIALDDQTVSDGSDPSTWNVTAAVQSWANGDLNAGFYLLFEDLNGIGLQSDDSANLENRPLLSVDFSGDPRAFEITQITYDPDTEMITLVWPSREADTYTVFWDTDLDTDFEGFAGDITDDLGADPGDFTTFTFPNPDTDADRMFFTVVKN